MTTHEMTINMGPQHPSTHGVLRLVLGLNGEVITSCEPHIGYLHRGIEKLAESKTYHQFLPITDRLDYLAAPSNNLAYCLAVEKLVGLEVPKRAAYIRMIITELSRIASHLVWLGTHALDIGAYTVFLYTFREREIVLDIFESYCGARLTTSCFRIGGVPQDLDDKLKKQIADFIKMFPKKIEEYEGLLTKNPIWEKRTKNIGIIPKEIAMSFGVTGPSLRGSGIDRDIRKVNPYSGYDEIEFATGKGRGIGDVYDRYLVRLQEMRESAKIITQALEKLPDGEILANCPKVVPPEKERVKTQLEALIHHFHIMSEGFELPSGEAYMSIEAPKGELSFYIVSNGGNKPYRMRIKTPSFVNLSCIAEIGKGAMIADMVAIIGSLDIVLGEIDR